MIGTKIDHEESIKTLRLFNEKVDTLKRLSFVKMVFMQDTGVQVSVSQRERIKVERLGPNEESISAFVLTFRYFIQDNERISFRNFAKLYNELPISHRIKEDFNNIRKSINNFLDSKSTVNIENSTNRYIMEVFVYGGLAHANPIKKEVFDRWMYKQILNTFLINEFVYILGVVMRAIEFMENLNLEVLKELEQLNKH